MNGYSGVMSILFGHYTVGLSYPGVTMIVYYINCVIDLHLIRIAQTQGMLNSGPGAI